MFIGTHCRKIPRVTKYMGCVSRDICQTNMRFLTTRIVVFSSRLQRAATDKIQVYRNIFGKS